MATIEIDFEVFKALTALRQSEAITCNDVIRDLLGLGGESKDQVTSTEAPRPMGCTFQGVHFPEGTEFRVIYKGQLYSARIESGAWMQNGRPYYSPSEAAVAITGGGVNGWRFWECKRPNDTRWRKMDDIRRAARLSNEDPLTQEDVDFFGSQGTTGKPESDKARIERLKAEERSLRERITGFHGADRLTRDQLHERDAG
jgi:hypothetical protein